MTAVPTPARRPSFAATFSAIFSGQLARARVAAIPIFLAATLQSVGLVVLLKGLVDKSDVTEQSVVAGSSVTVVSFVALNLLAQRFGALRASGALDYFGALPVQPGALVTATAAAWAVFTVPGSILVAVGGAAFYGLPLAHVWVIAPVVVGAGISLAGLGAVLGLLAPRPEIATVAGQLGMSLVMFLGLVPAHRLPGVVQAVRAVVPSTYAVDAFAESFKTSPRWTTVGADLGICVAVCVLALVVAAWAFRRAVTSGR
ncbi:MAG: type transport system permease protein [Actinomycetota bacterium]|jgi:ABC-2 type transport system permease protein|nr:type transport system permease protein [Actinomycetota bacterium]